MKAALPLLLLLFAGTAGAQKITDEHDRFTGERVVAYTNSAPARLGHPVLTIKVVDGPKGRLSLASIVLAAPPVGRRDVRPSYVGCKRIDWLVDGVPTNPGVLTDKPIFAGGGRIDNFIQELNADAFAAMAKAQSVEYRVCGHEFAFDTEDMAALRQISAALSGNSVAPPVGPAAPVASPASDCVACKKIGGG